MYAKFARLFVIAAIALVGANAAPAADVEDVNARAPAVDGHLFVCTDANFTGNCANLAFNINQCVDFTSPFVDSISSFGVDAGFICTIFTDPGCTGFPFSATSSTGLPDGFDNTISSFQCFHQ